MSIIPEIKQNPYNPLKLKIRNSSLKCNYEKE